MHLNPLHATILHQMQVAKGQVYTFNGCTDIDRYGVPRTIWDARRHLIPRKSYPYASERQVKRQQNTAQRLAFNHSFASNIKPSYIRLQRRLLKAET